jgi:hypothetical protein
MLTPWPAIAARLEAAVRADLVTVIYNPKSSRRPRQIREAQAIFLRHRDPATPVARVHAAYRPRQCVELTTLDAMAEGDIGMTTTLIIGDVSSFVGAGLMVTPRGYHRKYDLAEGGVHPGEVPRMPLSCGLDGWQQGLALEAARSGSPGPPSAWGSVRPRYWMRWRRLAGDCRSAGQPPTRAESMGAGMPAPLDWHATESRSRGVQLACSIGDSGPWAAALDAYERDLRASATSLGGDVDRSSTRCSSGLVRPSSRPWGRRRGEGAAPKRDADSELARYRRVRRPVAATRRKVAGCRTTA